MTNPEAGSKRLPLIFMPVFATSSGIPKIPISRVKIPKFRGELQPLLSDTPSGPLEINVDAVAATGDGGDTP